MSGLPTLPKALYSTSAFDAFIGGREFTLGDAKAEAWMCQLAYETADHDKIKHILASWGLALVDNDNGIVFKEVGTVLPIASTHAFVAAGRGATIVAFAGTDPLVLPHWITDFDAHIDRDTDTADGYRTAAIAVWPQIKALVEKSVSTNSKVIVTGHSLGGALAVLTANWLAAEPATGGVQSVYTFGMPRAGNVAFAAAYNAALGDRTYRLVYQDDLVPTVAPSELGFRHVGRYLHCDGSGKFDGRNLTADSSSDGPLFVRGISKQLTQFLNSPVSAVISTFERLRLASAMLLGTGTRTDPAGIAIELLPPVLRAHILDRYIGALS